MREQSPCIASKRRTTHRNFDAKICAVRFLNCLKIDKLQELVVIFMQGSFLLFPWEIKDKHDELMAQAIRLLHSTLMRSPGNANHLGPFVFLPFGAFILL